MTTKQELFKQRLDQLGEVVFRGFSYYNVWKALRLRDPDTASLSLQRQNELLGRYRGFFTPAVLALQEMAMIEFAKVFDQDQKTVSLRVLMNEARKRSGSHSQSSTQ